MGGKGNFITRREVSVRRKGINTDVRGCVDPIEVVLREVQQVPERGEHGCGEAAAGRSEGSGCQWLSSDSPSHARRSAENSGEGTRAGDGPGGRAERPGSGTADHVHDSETLGVQAGGSVRESSAASRSRKLERGQERHFPGGHEEVARVRAGEKGKLQRE